MRPVLFKLAAFCAFIAPCSVIAASSEGNTDPLTGFLYAIDAQGAVQGYFTQCTGMGSKSEVVEFRQGNSNSASRKLPGRSTFTNVVCRRGITPAVDIWVWRKQVEDGKISEARKNVDIILLDQTFTEIARWHLLNAWPARVSFVGPNDSSPFPFPAEEIELTTEDTARVK